LPVVLYGCEIGLFTLREEHGPRVFENRVLRRIFGLEREEVTGQWRELYIEELNDMNSTSIVLVIKW
jgi:PAS domain-containing protein